MLYYPILTCILISIVGSILTHIWIPLAMHTFIASNLKGIDLNKPKLPLLPESMGLIVGLMYLLILVLMLPVLFLSYAPSSAVLIYSDYYQKFPCYVSALLSITWMLFLGFADDILNIRWRYKLFLPAFASLPILFVYTIDNGITFVLVPARLVSWLGLDSRVYDLGIYYYVYMLLIAIFTTNSINILAGVNGVEVGQSLIIAISIVINSVILIITNKTNIETVTTHLFAIYLLVPFILVCVPLFLYNKFPARAFVGDTFTYFAGMVFASVGILGHFSKTLLLFFIPQLINFIISLPQLFHLVPCPRHRLPRLNKPVNKLEFSRHTIPIAQVSRLGHVILNTCYHLNLVHLEYSDQSVTYSNLTLINVVLVNLKRKWGLACVHESHLCNLIICIQIGCSVLAFVVRYGLAQLLYP